MRHNFYTKFATEVIHVTMNWADILPQNKICLISIYENVKMKTTAFVCYPFKNQLAKKIIWVTYAYKIEHFVAKPLIKEKCLSTRTVLFPTPYGTQLTPNT